MYYPKGHPEGVGKPWSVKHCGGDHYKCDYFCNGGEPNVGVYVTRAVHSSVPKSGKTLIEGVQGIVKTIGEEVNRNEIQKEDSSD